MFVSYKILAGSQCYGYMCFSGMISNVVGLHSYIEDRLFRKVVIQFISMYSDKKRHKVQIHTSGIYRNITWSHQLKNVEDIGDLYTYLYRKYGFTNILGYHSY